MVSYGIPVWACVGYRTRANKNGPDPCGGMPTRYANATTLRLLLRALHPLAGLAASVARLPGTTCGHVGATDVTEWN